MRPTEMRASDSELRYITAATCTATAHVMKDGSVSSGLRRMLNRASETKACVPCVVDARAAHRTVVGVSSCPVSVYTMKLASDTKNGTDCSRKVDRPLITLVFTLSRSSISRICARQHCRGVQSGIAFWMAASNGPSQPFSLMTLMPFSTWRAT